MTRRDQRVHSRDGKLVGHTTGGVRRCQLEGCPGFRLGVRWPDGRMSWPCSEGLRWEKGEIYIR